MTDSSYLRIMDNSDDEETPQAPQNPEEPVQKTPSRALDYFLEKPKESKSDLHVYSYNRRENKFKPYKMAKVKKNENFPQGDLDRMLAQLEAQGRPPRMDRIALVLGISIFITFAFCTVVVILEHLEHSKALTILLWTIALVPCGLTSLMCMVYCAGLWAVFGRMNSLNTLCALRNKEVFNPMGVNVVFSQNFEWFCVEIRNRKLLPKADHKIGKRSKMDRERDGTRLMDQIDGEFDF